jgi:uncharacterized protein YjdB
MRYAAFLNGSGRSAAAVLLFTTLLVACQDTQGPDPGPAPVPVAMVEVAPYGGVHAGVLIIGDTLRLTATARAAGGEPITGHPVTWSSADPGIAVVSSAGVVTALSAGEATIRAVVGGRTGTLRLRIVGGAPVHSLVIEQADGAYRDPLVIGDTVRLIAVARTVDGDIVAGRPAYWSSDDTGVATVAPAGLVTALGIGTANISVVVDGHQASIPYTVVQRDEQAAVADVRVTPTALIIEIDGSRGLTARAFDANGSEIHGRPVVWTSSAPAVAVVSQQGAVRALRSGYAEIKATIGGRTGAATIVVPTPEPVQHVILSPSTAAIWVNGSRQLTPTLLSASGGTLSGRSIAWHSENPGIASVDSTGRVRGVAAGTTRIIATSDGRSGQATVTVHPVPQAAAHVYRLDGTEGARATPTYIGTVDWVDGDGVTQRVARFIERGGLTLRFDTGRYEQSVEIDLYVQQPWRRVATITVTDTGAFFYRYTGGYDLRPDDPAKSLFHADLTGAAELTTRQAVADTPVLGWVWLLDENAAARAPQ